MTILAAVAAVACVVLAGACWSVYQLMVQNGALQLRLEALEKRLYSQGILTDDLHGVSHGRPIGSVLHDFQLPALAGGTMTLSRWRGHKIMLIFVSPSCEFSRAMLPELAALPAGEGRPQPVIISTGDEQENRRLFEEHGVKHPVLLQREAEVASLCWVNTTPAGFLVDEKGMSASILYTGADAVLSAARGADTGPATATTPGASRGFSRSLTESKIVRDGLKAGTQAPEFTLPRPDEGEVSLADYRGRNLLLVFSDPRCEPCDAFAPRLETLHRSARDFEVLMISRGGAEANRRMIADQGLSFPVVLQRHWEISRAYGIFATPVGYWIDEEGVLAADVAVGSEAILKLAGQASARIKRQSLLATR